MANSFFLYSIVFLFIPERVFSVSQQYQYASLSATNDKSGGSQKLSNSEKNSQPEVDEISNELLANIELEEDDYLDVVPPSPEEELPSFSPSVKSIR